MLYSITLWHWSPSRVCETEHHEQGTRYGYALLTRHPWGFGWWVVMPIYVGVCTGTNDCRRGRSKFRGTYVAVCSCGWPESPGSWAQRQHTVPMPDTGTRH